MSPERLLKYSQLPSKSPIDDLDVVTVDGQPLVVCTAQSDELWTWHPLDGWSERSLPWAVADEDEEEEDEDQDSDPLYPDFAQVGAAVVGGRILVATGGQHQGPALWDLDGGELLSRPEPWRVAETLDVFELGGRLHAFAGGGLEHFVWDPAAPAELDESARWLSSPGELCAVTAAQVEGRALVAAGGGGEVVVMDLETAEPLHRLEPSKLYINGVALTETMVAAVDEAGTIYRWNLADGTPLGDPIESGTEVRAMDTVVTADRVLAVTGHENGAVRLWDLTAGTELAPPMEDHEREVFSVVTTTFQDRPAAVTGGRDGIFRIWDLTP
ncbi:hypothetical protein GCM10010191_02470 [Actinomadura vinacea]|uniref:WD40 repeat domain-containing protein n=1 Tax=Actinomadura vinacea TaxID=115336 RepID=A0ABP5VC40_9ACTN